jgi:hypothetical protein
MVDLDQWLELADPGLAESGSTEPGLTEPGPAPSPGDPEPGESEAVAGVKRRLARVLTGGEHEMMAPPSAGVSDQAWAAMSGGERARFTRIQLRKLDPRLVPRLIVNWSGRRSIRSGY